MASTTYFSYRQARRANPISTPNPIRSRVHSVLRHGHTRVERKSLYHNRRRLSTSTLNHLDDSTDTEKLPRLSYPAVEYLNLAPKGTIERTDQIATLRHPRICVDSDGDFVDRFVLDNIKSSGRVYDRLYGREVPRLIAHLDSVVARHIYDVWEDRMRTRILMDDLRDINARKCLDVTDDERCHRYFLAKDFHFSDEEGSETQASDGSSYDADTEMSP